MLSTDTLLVLFRLIHFLTTSIHIHLLLNLFLSPLLTQLSRFLPFYIVTHFSWLYLHTIYSRTQDLHSYSSSLYAVLCVVPRSHTFPPTCLCMHALLPLWTPSYARPSHTSPPLPFSCSRSTSRLLTIRFWYITTRDE